jgi:hypothetical protein
MSDAQGTPLVGQYAAAAPPLDPSFFSTLESISAVVSDLIYNADGSKAGLSKSSSSEGWYELEGDVNTATKAIADINDGLAKEIKALKDALSGDAGDAFGKYATAILNTSEGVYDTLTAKQFGTAIGNVGHASQSFADGWWQIMKASDDTRDLLTTSMVNAAKTNIDAATTPDQVLNISLQLEADKKTMKSNQDLALLKDLQNALGALGNQYNLRGADLPALYISDGNTATAAPPKQFFAPGPPPVSEQPQGEELVPLEEQKPTGVEVNGMAVSGPTTSPVTPENTPGTLGSRVLADTGLKSRVLADTGPSAPTGEGQEVTAPTLTEPPKSADAGLSPGGTGGPTGAPAGDPAGQEALSEAKNAAGKAIDDLTAQSTDPKRTEALEAAKQAAQGAIDGLTGAAGEPAATAPGMAGAPEATAPEATAPGMAGGMSPAGQQALSDAKKAAGDAIDGLAAKSTDPKQTKALEDAKKAAEGAIDDLTDPADPTQAPGSLTGGPAAEKLDAAKDAAAKAIDDLTKPDDSAAKQQALGDAKKAAMDAINGIGDEAKAPDSSDPGAPADQQDREKLLDAKQAAEKAIDDLIGKTDDPECKAALEDAKNAVGDAIDKVAAPEHQQAVENAQHAADKAIDALRTPGDDPQRQQALDEAKAAADKAIDHINDVADLTGPGHEAALEEAKKAADQAMDALGKPDDTPAERQALADAKDAMHKAIDGITADGKTDDIRNFLAPDQAHAPAAPLGGIGGDPTGELAGVAAGGGGAGAGGAPPATTGRFDTQALQSAGPMATQGEPAAALTTPAPAAAMAGGGGGGAPMGGGGGAPMGGGGGGAGAGGQENKEREPQIWMQAEQGAWGDAGGDTPQNAVLGKD